MTTALREDETADSSPSPEPGRGRGRRRPLPDPGRPAPDDGRARSRPSTASTSRSGAARRSAWSASRVVARARPGGRSIRLRELTAGTVKFDGIDLSTLKSDALRKMRRRMQIIFQDPYGSLDPRMTVGATLAEPIDTHNLAKGAAKRERIADLLRIVGLDPQYVSPLPARVLGRPAPAHRRRPGAGRRTGIHRVRRAHLGARRLDPGAGAEPAHRPARAARADLPVHRPRPVGRQAHQRPGRRDVPGQDRRDRPARRHVRPAGPPLHAGPAVRGARARSGVRAAAQARRPPGRRAEPGQPARGLPLPHPLLAVRAARQARGVPHDRSAPVRLGSRPRGGMPFRREGPRDRRRDRPHRPRPGPARNARMPPWPRSAPS